LPDADLARLAAIAGTLGGVLGVAAFLPQAYRIVQRRSAGDISLSMYLLAMVSCVLWGFYAWVHGATELLVTNVALLFIVVSIVGLKLHFDRGK